jgi:uncharacterized protein (DUF433 family)
MTAALDTIRQLLGEMTPAEKAQVLQWVAQDLGNAFPGIERRANVQGGAACIVRTRIPIWTLVQFRQMGATDAELLHNYPTLTAQDIANAWAYYDAHRQEVEQVIAENKAA